MRAAVLGASGVIGRALVPVLAREHEVVAVSRRPRNPSCGRVRWVAADATRPSGLEPTLRGADVSTTSSTRSARRTSRSATAWPQDRSPQPPIWPGFASSSFGGLGDDREDLSAHLRSRTETARRLAAGPVPVTIVRSAVVVAGGSAAFETIVALVDRLPEMAGA